MTDRDLTRREALLAGGAAVGTAAALAGCTRGTDRSYWADPPAFDDAGLEAVTDPSLPKRPDPIPVSLPADRVDSLAARVEDLLAPIPDPLTPGVVPNGTVRTAITDARADARASSRRLLESRDTAPTLPVVEAGVDACTHAARAAGCWARIHTNVDADTVTVDRSTALGRMDALGDALPDLAADPQEGVVVYAPPERWADVTRRRRLVTPETVSGAANPLRSGEAAADLERTRAQAAVGAALRERYVASLSAPRAVEEAMTDALDALASRTEEAFLSLHDEEDPERPQMYPDLDEYLSREVPRDHPGRRLLSNEVGDFFDFALFAPLAWPSTDNDHPARTLRATHRSLATIPAFHDLRDRIDDGDDLFPSDGEAVAAARADAADRVRDLSASSSPLDRWWAWRLRPSFADPDRALTEAEDPDRRTVASAFGEYVWIATVGSTVADATAATADALRS